MRRALLLIGVLVSADAGAQNIDWALDGTVTFYGDNTEFANPFRRGETIFGTWAKVFAEARTSERLAIRAGVFGNQRFGSDDGFDEVRPVLALVIGSPRSRLVLGTLETVRQVDGNGPDRTGPHSLLPPLQVETLAFERPWEAGMQWIVDTDRIGQEAWVHWQQLNAHGRREVFDAGFKTRVRMNHALALRGEMLLVHQGGQQPSEDPVADSFAGVFGVEVGGPAGPLERLSLEAFGLASRFEPDREVAADTRSGFATFLRVSAEKSRWRGHLIVWRGDDFITREGDPNYQSRRRDLTSYRGLRDYAEAGLTRTFPLAPRSWLEASARWHRVENDYEYSFRILAVAGVRVD